MLVECFDELSNIKSVMDAEDAEKPSNQDSSSDNEKWTSIRKR